MLLVNSESDLPILGIKHGLSVIFMSAHAANTRKVLPATFTECTLFFLM